MAKTTRNEHAPNWVAPPGITIQETLDELGMSPAALAQRMGRPVEDINEIINAKGAITPETALQLERVFNVSAQFWNNLERQYREHVARAAEEIAALPPGNL